MAWHDEPRSGNSSNSIRFKFIGSLAGPVRRSSSRGRPNRSQCLGRRRSQKIHHRSEGQRTAFFDYDNDDWLDIYLTNGTRFNTDWPPGKTPTSHLYKNNRDGTFTDVTEKSGLARTGWQTGVCVGDYNNDGWDDLFCCFWGHNVFFTTMATAPSLMSRAKPVSTTNKSAGERMYVARLRPRRPSRSLCLQLHQARSRKNSLQD